MNQRYSLEFVLSCPYTSLEVVKNTLIEFGEGLEIQDTCDGQGKRNAFKIRIFTEEPTIIFDACAQFGRITSVKIEEGDD